MTEAKPKKFFKPRSRKYPDMAWNLRNKDRLERKCEREAATKEQVQFMGETDESGAFKSCRGYGSDSVAIPRQIKRRK